MRIKEETKTLIAELKSLYRNTRADLEGHHESFCMNCEELSDQLREDAKLDVTFSQVWEALEHSINESLGFGEFFAYLFLMELQDD